MKNKKLLITILMFSILLTFLIPFTVSAETRTWNELYDTWWDIPEGWSAEDFHEATCSGIAYINRDVNSAIKFNNIYIIFDTDGDDHQISFDGVNYYGTDTSFRIHFNRRFQWLNDEYLEHWLTKNANVWYDEYFEYLTTLKGTEWTLFLPFDFFTSDWYSYYMGSTYEYVTGECTVYYQGQSHSFDFVNLGFGCTSTENGPFLDYNCLTFHLGEGEYFTLSGDSDYESFDINFIDGNSQFLSNPFFIDFIKGQGFLTHFDPAIDEIYNPDEDFPDVDTPTTAPTIPTKNYGGVSLPTIDRYLDSNYKVAIVFADKRPDDLTGPFVPSYHLVVGYAFEKDYIYNEYSVSGSPESYCSIYNWQWYDLPYPYDTDWTYQTNGTNNIICRTGTYDLIWSSAPIYTDSSRTEYFFQITPPTEVTGTIAEIITAPIMAKVLAEVVEILPMTVLFLVGYLTLRKALSILVLLLEKA